MLFSIDDIILIQGRKSPDLLIGELNGMTGSFPIKDFKLFQGELAFAVSLVPWLDVNSCVCVCVSLLGRY